MLLSRLGVLCVVSCVWILACGGGSGPGDLSADVGTDGVEPSDPGIPDPGLVDPGVDTPSEDPGGPDGEVVQPDATEADAPDAGTADTPHDTFVDPMDELFDGIRPECRPPDLGCDSDDACAPGSRCIGTRCVEPVTPGDYAFSSDLLGVVAMALPAGDSPSGFDLNGDGVPDNMLAWAIGLYPEGTQVTNRILADFIRTGVFNLLVELRDLPSDACGPLQVALHPATGDLDLDGLPDDGGLQVRHDGFRPDGYGPVAQVNTAAIDGTLLRSGPGVELPLKLPLTDGTVLSLPLEGFRIELVLPEPPAAASPSGLPSAPSPRFAGAPEGTNAVIGGYVRLSRVVDEVNLQGRYCDCAGVDPGVPLATFRVDEAGAVAECEQAVDTGPCDQSADGRFCANLAEVCLAMSLMTAQADVASGVARDGQDRPIPDAVSLAFYLAVAPALLVEPPLAPDFAAVGDTWRASPDCDVLQDDGPTRIGVLANDHFLPDDPPTIVAVGTGDIQGAVQVVADGTRVVYTPSDGFFGFETFTYTIEDGQGNQSTAQVSMRVSPAIGYDPDRGLYDFCALWCRQASVCDPDGFQDRFEGNEFLCESECMGQFGNDWSLDTACAQALRHQHLCRISLPCFRLGAFDLAMTLLDQGDIPGDYRCETQVAARIAACGDCAPGTFGAQCSPCPTRDDLPCGGFGTCLDGSAGDGSCDCLPGYEIDDDTGSCRFDDPCDPDPCASIPLAFEDSCSWYWGQDNLPTYFCACDFGAFWNGLTRTCDTFCDPNPCLLDPNSTGVCHSQSLDYVCECIESFYFDPQFLECLPI